MRRLRLTTAGESHGPGLTATLLGLPAGLRVDTALLARDLARRQHGFGRGRRMQIEADAAEIRGGVRGGVTLGSPVVLWIANRDYANWQKVMGPAAEDVDPRLAELRRLKAPRPGHADLAGGLKYLRRDLRDVLERASARETAARVAAGAFAKMLLAELAGIEVRSGVRALGAVGADAPPPTWHDLLRMDDASPLRAIDPALEPEMVRLVERAQEAGDTLGGAVTVIAHSVPAGLGYAQTSGIPYELGIIRNHYVGRTFIEPTQHIRQLGVRLKHSANRAVVAGKRIVLIDDSIVRGTTSVKIVQMMRDAGAREVHFRIASPPITHPDYYGIDTPERDKLLAATHDLEGMRNFIGADSLAFLSVEGIYRAMGEKGRDPVRPQFTDHCFTGEYPTLLTDRTAQDASPRQLSLLAEAS